MRFHDLAQLQRVHKDWLDHNFPAQENHDALLGIMEEVGELAHAHLKWEQGIRGYDLTRYKTEALDAVGDIVIYLASYCNSNHLDLEAAVMLAWNEVSKRDWQNDPVGGKPPFTGRDHPVAELAQGEAESGGGNRDPDGMGSPE